MSQGIFVIGSHRAVSTHSRTQEKGGQERKKHLHSSKILTQAQA